MASYSNCPWGWVTMAFLYSGEVVGAAWYCLKNSSTLVP